MKPTNTLQRAVLITLLIATAACAEDPMNKPNPKPEPASLVLWRQIQAEVGDASCDGPQQCHSIGIGAKSCGGPESFLAWSSKRTDAKKLQSLVDQHRAAREAENRSSGMASNCMLETDPGVRCVPKASGQGQVCVLNERNRGSGGSAI